MLPMQQIQRFLQVFGKSIALLWSAAPILTALLIIGQLLQGLAPAVSVWIVKQVVDTISTAITQKVNVVTNITFLLGGWIAALMLESTFRLIIQMVGQRFLISALLFTQEKL
jgi:ATP-binding cassette, subfamily B, bacterial